MHEALAKGPQDRPGAAAILMRLLGGAYDSRQALRAGAGAAARVRAPGGAAAATVPLRGAAPRPPTTPAAAVQAAA
ncbi:hypothetical protein [Streptomyces glomeratus]|uniref:hypothetical protein n=1 Tax=Streptomyces glomeratus TaxID=284452 RepID=UPI001F2099D0|nr:hypothetical protein [Streptomyces glomeratus]MCF1512593.1 hypothetical protein [Streptomyces glomeratus]